MTIGEIMAAMQALVDQYNSAAADATGAPDPAAATPMPADAVARYEELEGMLQMAQKTQEIQKRNAAYRTNVTALPVASEGAKNMSADAHSAAFRSFMNNGNSFLQTAEGAQYRAQSEGLSSAGGFLVPTTLSDKIIERLKAFGGFGQAAEQLTTASGNPFAYVTNDDVSNLGALVPENSLITTGADLVFGERLLGAYKFATVGANSLPLKVSWELLQDSSIDIESFIAKKFAERIQRKLADAFVNGSGISEPQGVLNGGLTAATQWSSNTAPTYADLVNIVHSLDPAYRSGAKWVFNDKTMALIEKLVDSTGRPLIWNTQGLLADAPNERMLLGYPVIIDQAFADPSGGNSFGIFGDPSQAYIVRKVKDFTMVVLNELYAPNGQTGYIGWGRWDGMVQDVNAAVTLHAA